MSCVFPIALLETAKQYSSSLELSIIDVKTSGLCLVALFLSASDVIEHDRVQMAETLKKVHAWLEMHLRFEDHRS
jgi:hypothetical protein